MAIGQNDRLDPLDVELQIRRRVIHILASIVWLVAACTGTGGSMTDAESETDEAGMTTSPIGSGVWSIDRDICGDRGGLNGRSATTYLVVGPMTRLDVCAKSVALKNVDSSIWRWDLPEGWTIRSAVAREDVGLLHLIVWQTDPPEGLNPPNERTLFVVRDLNGGQEVLALPLNDNSHDSRFNLLAMSSEGVSVLSTGEIDGVHTRTGIGSSGERLWEQSYTPTPRVGSPTAPLGEDWYWMGDRILQANTGESVPFPTERADGATSRPSAELRRASACSPFIRFGDRAFTFSGGELNELPLPPGVTNRVTVVPTPHGFLYVADGALTLHDGASLLWSIPPDSWSEYEYSFGQIAVSNSAGEWFTFDLLSGPSQLSATTPDRMQVRSIFTFSTSAGVVSLAGRDWHFWEGDICDRPQGTSFSVGTDTERVNRYHWHSSYD